MPEHLSIKAARKLITKLAIDPHRVGLEDMATFYALPGATLAGLAQEALPAIRQLIASHANTPGYILEQLARDPAPGVRRCAALNNRLLTALLLNLTKDPDASVQEAALRMLNYRKTDY